MSSIFTDSMEIIEERAGQCPLTKNVVLAHTTNFDVVLTRGSEGHGIHIGRKVVGDSHAR